MSTTLELISELETEVLSATTQQSKFSREKLIAFLNEGRALGISNSAQGGTRLHPQWTQKYVAIYSSTLQESDCYTLFNIPSAIKFKKLVDGYLYFGDSDFTTQYTRVNSQGEFTNALNHPLLSRSIKSGTTVLVQGTQAKVYHEKSMGRIHSLGVMGIYSDPTSLYDFNLMSDEYPIDATTMEWVRGWLKQTILNQIAQTPILSEKTNKELTYQVPNRRR